MARRTFESKLARVLELSAYQTRQTLMRAYIACFKPRELCRAISQSWEWPTDLHLAFVKRFARLDFGRAEDVACRFIGSLIRTPAQSPKMRKRTDALLSRVFDKLPLDIRDSIVDRWLSQGTAEGVSRWLKGIRDDEAVAGLELIKAYWRVSADDRAARVLIARLPPEQLKAELEEILSKCEHGWTASRAMMSVKKPTDGCWRIVSERFPASYANLCAKLGRQISKGEALDLIARCEEYWPSDEQGLAIWSVGELGLWDALDAVEPILDAQDKRRVKEFEKSIGRLSPRG